MVFFASRRFGKECREDVVAVVAYELSKVAIQKCLKYSKNLPGLHLFFPKIYEDMNFISSIEIVVIGGDAKIFKVFEEFTGTPFVFPEDISRHEFYKWFGKGCWEDVVVVVAYELSKVMMQKCSKYSKNSPELRADVWIYASIEPVRVTPNIFVPAPNGRPVFDLYDKAFRGIRRRYTTIPGLAYE
ncbi:uncharacterized protein Pyn_14538 [Prunus yedoensis var. nudiflora]|uniref:Uncharacterized protein n=1 Tax=Prunus yedoensis var. nudiflora TaxID=2094558 RepID=A0A314Y613_PRUYE|nr:uncharacterized protein Pyn_14538 [Prunus yedoensis var. nudiflora]